MKGWTEEEFRNRELMAPCGLYCGTCGVYLATRDGNEKFKAVMGNLYGTKPEETECLGCMQPDPPKKIYGFCRRCKIRSCVKSKGLLLLPPMRGMALRSHRKILLRHRGESHEKGDSDLAGESRRTGGRKGQRRMGPIGMRALSLLFLRSAPLSRRPALSSLQKDCGRGIGRILVKTERPREGKSQGARGKAQHRRIETPPIYSSLWKIYIIIIEIIQPV